MLSPKVDTYINMWGKIESSISGQVSSSEDLNSVQFYYLFLYGSWMPFHLSWTWLVEKQEKWKRTRAY